LLNQYFELGTYDNLLKSELTSAINNRYEKIKHKKNMQKMENDA
jgi:hypothetical protein